MCASKPTLKKQQNFRSRVLCVESDSFLRPSYTSSKPPPNGSVSFGAIVAVHMSSFARYARDTSRTILSSGAPAYKAPHPQILLSSLPVPRGRGATGARSSGAMPARSHARAMREAAAAMVPSPPPARNLIRPPRPCPSSLSRASFPSDPTSNSSSRRSSRSWLLLSMTSTSTPCSLFRRFTAVLAPGALTLTITHTRSCGPSSSSEELDASHAWGASNAPAARDDSGADGLEGKLSAVRGSRRGRHAENIPSTTGTTATPEPGRVRLWLAWRQSFGKVLAKFFTPSCELIRRLSPLSPAAYMSLAAAAMAASLSLSAPVISCTLTPLEYSWKVGMAEMPHSAATSSRSSTSILTKTTSGYLAASSSKKGPIFLHGPHQDAVKSTRTCAYLGLFRGVGVVTMCVLGFVDHEGRGKNEQRARRAFK